MDADHTDLGSVCLLTGCHDQSQLSPVIAAVKKLQGTDRDIVYVGRQDMCDDARSVRTPSQLLVELYRHHKLGGSGCKTVLSAESQLVVVQLCLAEYSKQKYDIYDTDVGDVLHVTRELNDHKLSHCDSDALMEVTNQEPDDSRDLSQSESVRRLYKEFLSHSNVVDLVDVYRRVSDFFKNEEDGLKLFQAKQRMVVLQWPSEPLERKILELLCGQTNVTEIRVEMLPAAPSDDGNKEGLKLHVSERHWNAVQDIAEGQFSSMSPKNTPRSAVSSSSEVLVRQVFLSFLGLLVNSRDEISLARCLSYSQTGLDHKGFTALKRVSKTKNMPMYQTAVSYIIRLRLGGKSYAPNAESTSLSEHVKSLSEFVTNVQKLHILVGEIPDTRQSITKVLQTIKGILCKCRDSIFKTVTVEKVCDKLRSEFEVLLTSFNERSETSPPKAVNQGGSILGRQTYKLILTFLDEDSASTASLNPIGSLSDYTLTQSTPVRMPSLLQQFRSPTYVDPESPKNQKLRDRVSLPTKEVKQPKVFGQKSDMTWAEPTRRHPLQEQSQNIDRTLPSPSGKQPFKLWAVTPPEKHLQAKTFIHDFDSPTTNPLCKLTTKTHPSSNIIDHTPKRPKGRGRKITEAALDKENVAVNTTGNEVQSKGAGTKKKGAEVKRRVKRVLMEDTGSGQPSKKAKKGGVGGQNKKKQMTLVKGQKTLNQFFRM